MSTQISPSTDPAEPSAPSDGAMHALQYAVAAVAIIGAALLAGLR